MNLQTEGSLHPTWTEALLGGAKSSTWAHEGQRLLVAVGLAALFGAALGLRHGGVAIASHALGVPAGILAVTALAVPALAIILALANAPVEMLGLAKAATRASVNAGLVLGGLAPAAALFMVTVEDDITVTIMGFVGLLLAGALAIRSFWQELGPQLAAAPDGTRRLTAIAMPAFLLFASVLAARVWWITLPTLTGGL